jgi:uncharacterized protein (TIGR01777 family)
MRIGVTGARGFVGSEVVRLAAERGHRVVGFSRDSSGEPPPGWDEVRGFGEKLDLSGLGAIVHLAGEPIAGVWTRSKKERIRASRVQGTAAVADAIRSAAEPPGVLVCASGTGYYGDRADEPLDETSPPGDGFLASVVLDWEAASAAAAPRARVVNLRFGMVLGKGGGALPLLGRLFRLGLGGRVGSGHQWMPWIHVRDAAGLVLHAAENPACRGPVNAVAPGAVTNAVFTGELAGVLHRPAVLPVPGAPVRLLAGSLSELVLSSQRVVPEAALRTGFRFEFPELPGALRDVFG